MPQIWIHADVSFDLVAFNEHHDEKGRFSEGESGGSGKESTESHRQRTGNVHIDRAVSHCEKSGVASRVLNREQAERMWDGKVDQVAASYDMNHDKIFINSSFHGWQNPQESLDKASKMGPNGWFSSTHPDHYVNHEIGHAMHRKKIGEDVFRSLKEGKPEGRGTILREVSAYGSVNRLEFVAETYAGMKAGKTYSQPVMNYYDRLGGARP